MFRRTAIVVSLLLLLAGCQRATLTKVVTRTGIVVGELLATRPDAVVVRRSDGSEYNAFRAAGRTDHANAKGDHDRTL